MEIGMKIYYDKYTGNVLVNTGERSGDVVESTQEYDFEVYKALAERVPETIGVIALEYGEYAQDFRECSGYKVDVKTGKLKFSYPDPNETPEQLKELQYVEPLTEQMESLKQSQAEQDSLIMSLLLGGEI
ncbi:hypothetical protein MHH52_25745 [Paenibacillus sp. FSL K6-0276]|uniref:hypothetical protein n=1 Tax=Paenibacillus sp. FSL K6-0276 TaxID=2921450 RepID=UPI0030EEF745